MPGCGACPLASSPGIQQTDHHTAEAAGIEAEGICPAEERPSIYPWKNKDKKNRCLLMVAAECDERNQL
jgi:hypothetical protein